MKRIPVCVGLLILSLLPVPASGQEPKNVILVIADGMGPEQVKAGRSYRGAPLSFESAPHQAEMTTSAVDVLGNPVITDSAASATAIATGRKVLNTVISVAWPGDRRDLTTSLEIWATRGRSAGLVTTSFIEDATPAAFAAHTGVRILVDEITEDYLERSRPALLLGAINSVGTGMDPAKATAAGYTVVQTRDELFALDLETETHVSGQFGADSMGYEWDYERGSSDTYDTVPLLSEMTEFALSFLERDPDGFFLVIEQENTDSSGHLGNEDPDKTGRNVFATLELSDSVQILLDWLEAREDPDDTLLLVTADHETGGLEVLEDNGAGELPTVSWQGDDHTDTKVPVYAWSPYAAPVSGILDNTDLFLITVPEPSTTPLFVAVLVTLGVLARSFPASRAGASTRSAHASRNSRVRRRTSSRIEKSVASIG